uniref:hypothetical protein n=1 Tax=Candidatus Ulvibacter alkanivorans TaxID=2267620 RepID=UPI001444677C
EYTNEKGSKVSSDQIRQRYDEIIKQNSEFSSTLADKIKLMDINEESADLVANTIREIEHACNKQSFGEKMTNMLPAPIRNATKKMRSSAEVGLHKQRTVTELAQRHFDALNEKKTNLTESLGQIYVIRDKLVQSTEELGKMEQLLIGHTKEVKKETNIEGNSANARMEMLKSKEMTIQVQSQILTQRDLISQIDAVQYVAEQVTESITHTLPTIKANFIDQISITAGLKNMRDLKDSIDKTRNMTLTLQENTFKDMKGIMEEIHKNGMGYTDSEMKRIDDLQKERQRFHASMNDNFTKSDEIKTKQIKRLSRMMAEQNSFLGMSESHQLEEQRKQENQDNQDNNE